MIHDGCHVLMQQSHRADSDSEERKPLQEFEGRDQHQSARV
jgi:hypothetical protein